MPEYQEWSGSYLALQCFSLFGSVRGTSVKCIKNLIATGAAAQVDQCCMAAALGSPSADGNERQSCQWFGVPQRHPHWKKQLGELGKNCHTCHMWAKVGQRLPIGSAAQHDVLRMGTRDRCKLHHFLHVPETSVPRKGGNHVVACFASWKIVWSVFISSRLRVPNLGGNHDPSQLKDGI